MQGRSPNNAQGIDVSHWQGIIDWRKVQTSGKVFVYIKASQGVSGIDSQFVQNARGAKAAGMLVGVYHFITASSQNEAREEAQHFVNVMKKVGDAAWFDLPPALDYEDNPKGISTAQINTVAQAFMVELTRLTGRKPILYTGNAFASNFNAALGVYDLWVARYSETRVPDNRPAWSKWTFWQYSDSGRVPGITGNVDLNEFSGTAEQLRAYISGKGGGEVVNPGEKTVNEPSPWAANAWKEATANGYFDGTRPKNPLTREEAAILINRLRSNILQLIAGNKERMDDLERRLTEIERAARGGTG